MNSGMKKSLLNCIAFMLAALMLLTSAILFASCGETGVGDATTAEPAASSSVETPETEINAKNILGARDMGQTTVTYYTRYYSGEWKSDLFAEETTGDTVNDAILRRNLAIEALYNVKMAEIKSGAQSFYKTIQSLVSVSDTSYDVIFTSCRDASYLTTEGVLLEVHDLPNIDAEASWWSPFLTKQVSIANKNYYITGEITTIDNIGVRCLYFNKDILASIGGGDLYAMVDNDTWTLEALLDFATKAGADKNGDSKYEIGVDAFGLLAEATLGYQLLMGADELVIEKDEEDIPYIAIGDPRPLEIVDFITARISDNPAVITDAVVTNNFVNGDILFILAVMARVRDMRTTDIEFGVLPLPKYNADQQRYTCYSDAYCPNAICFPTTTTGDRLDDATFLTEALAVESVKTVTPEFYEVCMKTKYARDENSGRMIEIILNNYTMDLVDVYITQWGFRKPVQTALTEGQSMSTIVKTYKTSVTKKIQDTVKAIQDLDH